MYKVLGPNLLEFLTMCAPLIIKSYACYALRHSEEKVGIDKEMSLRKYKKNYHFSFEHGRLRFK
jgi:hypothetical protein